MARREELIIGRERSSQTCLLRVHPPVFKPDLKK